MHAAKGLYPLQDVYAEVVRSTQDIAVLMFSNTMRVAPQRQRIQQHAHRHRHGTATPRVHAQAQVLTGAIITANHHSALRALHQSIGIVMIKLRAQVLVKTGARLEAAAIIARHQNVLHAHLHNYTAATHRASAPQQEGAGAITIARQARALHVLHHRSGTAMTQARAPARAGSGATHIARAGRARHK